MKVIGYEQGIGYKWYCTIYDNGQYYMGRGQTKQEAYQDAVILINKD